MCWVWGVGQHAAGAEVPQWPRQRQRAVSVTTTTTTTTSTTHAKFPATDGRLVTFYQSVETCMLVQE